MNTHLTVLEERARRLKEIVRKRHEKTKTIGTVGEFDEFESKAKAERYLKKLLKGGKF